MGLLSRLVGGAVSKFNVGELNKIQSAIQGNPHAKVVVAMAIAGARPQIEDAKNLPEPERKRRLVALLNEAGVLRHKALESGATGHGHPEWAAASVVESWINCLLAGNDGATQKAEMIIGGMERG